MTQLQMIWQKLKILYFEEKNYDKAIKLYDEAIVDGCKVAIENIGDLYDQMGDIEKAISYYQRNSMQVSCQVKLGDIFRKIDQIDEAIVWYKKAYENNDIHSAYALGCIYEELEEFNKAKEYFLEAIEKNHANSRIHLGRIYYNEGKYEDAKKMFEITAHENNIYSQHMVGLICEENMQDYTNAKFWYEKAREQGCVESIFNLGQLSVKLDDITESEKYFTEGLSMEDKSSEYMLAYIYLEKSKRMFMELSESDYENTKDVIKHMPEIDIDKDKRLIPPFIEINENDEEEEYIPQYILVIDEDLESELEQIEDNMKIVK